MKNSYLDRFFIRNGNTITWIFITNNSGKIIYRDKVDTLMNVTHPGIILGKNSRGEEMVIHNHYQIGYAEIVTLNEFTLGSRYFFDPRKVFYSKKIIIERAIESWKEKKPYEWLTNNCQQFVNRVVTNKNFSEDVDKISDGALWLGGITSVVGMMSGNGTALKVGLTIAGVGVAGKTLNN